MSEHTEQTDDKDAEKAAHAERDAKVDDAVEDTFPASDPPSTTPPPGTRKAEQIEAEQKDEAENE
ncbi:MAG: hypothetical protein ACJ8AW_12660 [Rhodopila sp.]|jgi:hypothetical protein